MPRRHKNSHSYDFDFDDFDYYDKPKSQLIAERKNEELTYQLYDKRSSFAGIGTNKAKRRLNKLALTNPIAKVVRLAMEIEDKNIYRPRDHTANTATKFTRPSTLSSLSSPPCSANMK